MGKHKSEKAKLKKEQRKRESAVLKEATALIKAAEAIDDFMPELTPFQVFDRNGIKAKMQMFTSKNIPNSVRRNCFDILKSNMFEFYDQSSWGWKDSQKWDELMDDSARFLVAFDSTELGQQEKAQEQEQEQSYPKPLAFIHFRFVMEELGPAMYIYEMQIRADMRRKGLGKVMMCMMELSARRHKMNAVVLTVFKDNTEAVSFYKDALHYQLDISDPSLIDPLSDDEYDYMILSKVFPATASS